jgi:hypothetical protein
MRTLRRSALRPALAAALLLGAVASSAAAQSTRGTLSAVVVARATGEPLAQAHVAVRETRSGGYTDSDGALAVEGLRPGQYTVEVTRLGYLTTTSVAALVEGQTTTLRVAMDPSPVAMDTVEAEVRTWGRRYLEAHGFFERKSSIPGSFITRQQIERDRPRSLSFLLQRYRRLLVHDDTWSRTATARRAPRGTVMGACSPNYFVDGVLVTNMEVESVNIANVEGIEVYRGASEIPPEFNRQNRGACGAVVIWTRVR